MTETQFGRYSLVRRIGTGGMAEIWKARVRGPAGFEKILAIKKVLPDLSEDGSFVDMFIEEAKLAATLVHPNIVQVFDFGRIGRNDYFIAMEYVSGANIARLQYRLQERKLGPLPVDVAIYVASEVCKGLGHAHRATDLSGKPLGIVHRDVSPQNVLLSFGGEVKIVDFGIAKAATMVSRTREGEVRGKLAYMSPEQASGEAVLDGRSDLFSLAIVLYELVTGQRFFGGSGSMHEIYSRVASYKGLTTEQLERLPEGIRGVLATALEPRPEGRFKDARELEVALTCVLPTDGVVLAREALSNRMRTLFSEKLRVEMEPAAVDPEHTVTSAARGGASMDVGVSFARPAPLAPEPPRAGANVAEPKRKSGYTLAPEVAGGRSSHRRLAIGGIVAGLFSLAVLASALSGRHASLPPPIAAASVAPSADPTAAALALSTAARRPAAAPSRAPAAMPASTHIAVSTPRPVRTSKPAAAPGFLFVTARPWVEVWVDGARVARETPLRAYSLPAGKHTLRFVNTAQKFSMEKPVEIPSDGNLTLYVDVPSKTIELD